MSQKSVKVVAFDLDGTLTQSIERNWGRRIAKFLTGYVRIISWSWSARVPVNVYGPR